MPLSFLGYMIVSLGRTLTRPLKPYRKSKRIQSLLSSEKKKTCRNLGSVYSLSLVFGFLEKHQKRQIEMEPCDHPSVGQSDSECLGTGTPVSQSQSDAGINGQVLALWELTSPTQLYPASRKPPAPIVSFSVR